MVPRFRAIQLQAAEILRTSRGGIRRRHLSVIAADGFPEFLADALGDPENL